MYGYRGNGETRPFAKVIRLGDLFSAPYSGIMV